MSLHEAVYGHREKLAQRNHIHATAVIDDTALIGADNIFGPFCYVGPGVVIGNKNNFTSHVAICDEAEGRERPLYHRKKLIDSRDGIIGNVTIGDGNVFHSFVVVGESLGEKPTTIGNNCYFMHGAHVSHDCQIEDNVTLCHNVVLCGHCTVMKGTTLGSGTEVHQRQVIGSYVQTGLGTVIPKHENIYSGGIYAGNPVAYLGANKIGLKRHEVSQKALVEEDKRYDELRDIKPYIDIKKCLNALTKYSKNRDGSVIKDKWALCAQVVSRFPSMSYQEWAPLYDRLIGMLWQQQNDFVETQIKIYNELIEPSVALFTAEPLPTTGDRTAFLLRHVVGGMYAPFNHIKAFIHGWPKDKQMPIIFCYGLYDKSERDRFEAMDVEVIQVDDPQQVINACQHYGVDTLVTESYSSLALASFALRAAPNQMYLSPGFQLFPADLVLVPVTQTHLASKTEGIQSPMMWEDLYKAPYYKNDRDDKPVVFGVLGRYEKLSDEFLSMVIEILDKVPGSEFHAYGRGTLEHGDPRIIAKGYADAHKALSTIDVYLDSYPLCGGVSVWQAMAHRVPVVTRNSDDVNSWNLFKPHVVNTREEYVELALRQLEQPQTDVGFNTAKNFADIKTAGKRLWEIIDGFKHRNRT